MEGKSAHLPPGDPQLITNIVNHLKSQGIFDQFRRDLLADADTKPSYQNLRQRVEGYASKFLAQQTWQPDLNKNQLRDTLRRQINESGMLASGVDHVLEQLLSPKIFHVFLPQVDNLVKEYLGLKKPPPPDPFENSEKAEKTETVQPKTEEVAAVPSNDNAALKRPLERSTSETADLQPLKQDVQVTAVPACQEKTDDEMADDSLVISESGAEQSDSSIFDYTGPMGKTPPPPGVSEDEIESFKKVSDLESTEKEKSQSESPEREDIKTEMMDQEVNQTEATESKDEAMEQENSGIEINVSEAENVSQNSDFTDAPMNYVLEEEKNQQKQEVRPPEKKVESTKVISEKEKKSEKSKILPVHEKARSAERDRSKSVDLSKSKSSESKTSSKPDPKQKSEVQENKPKKADGLSSKSKTSSGGFKRQESSHSKTPRDPTRSSEHKTVKSSSESPAKIDRQRSPSAHSSKSAFASSSGSKSSKSKTSSSYKSGKPEEGKTTSSKSDSSKTSKHTSLGSKSKHSIKHFQKHRHSEDSKEEQAKPLSISPTKSQPSEEKHEISKPQSSKNQGTSKFSAMQKTKIAEEEKGDQQPSSKEGKHSKIHVLEKPELKDPESKLCKDGHGCVRTIPEMQLHGLVDYMYSSNEESISSPQTCGTSTGCDSETNTCSIPSEICKPDSTDIQTNVDDTISDPVGDLPVEAVSEENSTSCEDRPDDFLRELLMEKKVEANLDETKSDITVSSVHTSDLSSFDDGISLSSVDEIPEVEQKKKIPLKEVKVIAAVLKEKSNSSGRSTPVMSSVEPEANKQEIFLEIKEIQQDDGKTDEFPTEEDKDGSKMWLRRQRKVNPKYASEEYSSIFTEGMSTCGSDSIEDAPSRRITRSSQDVKFVVGSSQEGISGEKKDPQKRKLSKDDEPETKPKAAKISRRNEPVENTEASSKKEVQLRQTRDRRRNTRSDSESQEVPEQTPPETSTRKRRSTSSSTVSPDVPKHEPQTRALTSSQRYDSSDLYKPRPIITSRRTRSTQETPNTQDTSMKGRTTRQSSPAPRKR